MSKSTKAPLSQTLVKEIKARKKRQEAQELPSKASAKKGLPPGWTRTTIIIKEEHRDKLERLAFWSKMPVKDALHKILDTFFRDKKIQPIPKLGNEEISKLFSHEQDLES